MTNTNQTPLEEMLNYLRKDTTELFFIVVKKDNATNGELIINSHSELEDKINYYAAAYSDDLKHNNAQLYIVDYGFIPDGKLSEELSELL